MVLSGDGPDGIATSSEGIRVVPSSGESLRGALLVIGFPTHGLVGPIAANYLVRFLGMKPVAYLASDALPPTIIADEGNALPPVRVYATELVCGPDARCDRLAVVTSDVQLPVEILHPLARTLLRWAQSVGVELVVVLEGVPAEEDSMDTQVQSVANERGVPVAKRCALPGIDGSVTGLAGALLLASYAGTLPVVCLATPAHKAHPDAKAASALVDSLRHLIPKITLDTEPLRKEAEKLEASLKRNLGEQKRSMENLGSSPPTGMYV